MDYYTKYLKYKKKYIDLKFNFQYGRDWKNIGPGEWVRSHVLKEPVKYTYSVWLPFPKDPTNAGALNRTSAISGTKLILGSPFWRSNADWNKKFSKTGMKIPMITLERRHTTMTHTVPGYEIVNLALYDELNSDKYHFIFMDSPETLIETYQIKTPTNYFDIRFETDKHYVLVFGHEKCGFSIYDYAKDDCAPKEFDRTFFEWFLSRFPNSSHSFAFIPQAHSGIAWRKGDNVTLNYSVVASATIGIALAYASGVFDTSLKYELPKLEALEHGLPPEGPSPGGAAAPLP